MDTLTCPGTYGVAAGGTHRRRSARAGRFPSTTAGVNVTCETAPPKKMMIALPLLVLAKAAAASESILEVGASPVADISPVLYSLFLETEINFGGEGGLYAEMLVNRDFETLGRGTIPGAFYRRDGAQCRFGGSPRPPVLVGKEGGGVGKGPPSP